MLVAELSLMSEPVDSIRERAEALREFLPSMNIDKVVQV
jgi:hypothetical protein